MSYIEECKSITRAPAMKETSRLTTVGIASSRADAVRFRQFGDSSRRSFRVTIPCGRGVWRRVDTAPSKRLL